MSIALSFKNIVQLIIKGFLLYSIIFVFMTCNIFYSLNSQHHRDMKLFFFFTSSSCDDVEKWLKMNKPNSDYDIEITR